MCWKMFLVTLTLLLGDISLRLTSSAALPCDVILASDDVMWRDDVTNNTSILFDWHTQKVVCNSDSDWSVKRAVHEACHLAAVVTSSADLDPMTSRSASTHLLLHPGVSVRVYFNDSRQSVYVVNHEMFESCATANNDSLALSGSGDQTILIPWTLLQQSSVAYIVATPSASANIACDRLLIEVASGGGDCNSSNSASASPSPSLPHPPADDGMTRCSGRGLCIAASSTRRFSCRCCAGYHDVTCGMSTVTANTTLANYRSSSSNSSSSNSDSSSNACYSNPCQHGASCLATNMTSFTCTCVVGYTGQLCEININDCASQPCANGICLDKINSYQCFCMPGFAGDRCEINYDECLSNPCVNGGICIDDVNSFTCRCLLGYSGPLCEVKVDLCTPNPCKNASVCVDYGHYLACSCYPGYAGATCELDIDECASSPCRHGGTCRDAVNGFACDCLPDYFGPTCELDELGDDVMIGDQGQGHHRSREETRRLRHVRNLYVIVGTLTGAAVLALLVLLVCYCHTYESYKWILRRRRGYEMHKDLTTSVRVMVEQSSINTCRPTWENIADAASGSSGATCLHHSDSTANTPLVLALRSKLV